MWPDCVCVCVYVGRGGWLLGHIHHMAAALPWFPTTWWCNLHLTDVGICRQWPAAPALENTNYSSFIDMWGCCTDCPPGLWCGGCGLSKALIGWPQHSKVCCMCCDARRGCSLTQGMPQMEASSIVDTASLVVATTTGAATWYDCAAGVGRKLCRGKWLYCVCRV